MNIRVKLYATEAEFNAEKSSLTGKWIAYTDDDKKMHYSNTCS